MGERERASVVELNRAERQQLINQLKPSNSLVMTHRSLASIASAYKDPLHKGAAAKKRGLQLYQHQCFKGLLGLLHYFSDAGEHPRYKGCHLWAFRGQF